MFRFKDAIATALTVAILSVAVTMIPAIGRFMLVASAQTQVTGNGPFTLMNFFEGAGNPFGTCNTVYNYGLFYWDHSNNNIWVCAADGWAEASGGGGGGATAIEHDIAFTTTPALFPNDHSTSTIVLTANASPTMANGLAAACVTIVVKQGAGGPWGWTWPANMHGGMSVSTGRNSQSFCYYNTDSIWVANSPGVTGE